MANEFAFGREDGVDAASCRSVFAAGAGLHEGDCYSVERVDESGDLAALNRGLGIGGLQSAGAGGCYCSAEVVAHESQPPASGRATRRSDDLKHGLLELEERLARSIADLADSAAWDANRLVGGDRGVEHGRHHDDVLEVLDAVGVAAAKSCHRIAARLEVETGEDGSGDDARHP